MDDEAAKPRAPISWRSDGIHHPVRQNPEKNVLQHPHAPVVNHAHSSQGKFDEGFTRIYIDRIAGGHRDHRNSCRHGVVRVQPHPRHVPGDHLPEQSAAMGHGNACFLRRTMTTLLQRTAPPTAIRPISMAWYVDLPDANESAALSRHAVANECEHRSRTFHLDLSQQSRGAAMETTLFHYCLNENVNGTGQQQSG